MSHQQQARAQRVRHTNVKNEAVIQPSATRRRGALVTRIATPSFVLAGLFAGGCAFTTGHVNVSYTPAPEVTKIAGDAAPKVLVEVTDKRPTQVLGEKINGFGMKTADIVADNDVAATIKSAFETELEDRGFAAGTGGNVIAVTLVNFQNQYTPGFWSGEAQATLGMDVAVKNPDGSTPFNKYFQAEVNDWIEIAGEDNAQLMLDGALEKTVSKVFADSDFIRALNPK